MDSRKKNLPIDILGFLGPALSAIIVIRIWKGKEGLKELGKRCIKYTGIGLNYIFPYINHN